MTALTRLIVATGNAHKTGEIAAALRQDGCTVEIVSARETGGMPEVEETGDTFAANARLKAEALAGRALPGEAVLADDSGLAVEALGGAPGVYSARYAGENASDADNNAKLLRALDGKSGSERTARFVCHFVLLGPGVDAEFRGECPGTLLEAPAGDGGFGYDPLFVPEGHTESFARLGEQAKAALSHRARACQSLAAWLRESGG